MAKRKKDRVTLILYTAFVVCAFVGGIVLAWSLQQWSSADNTSGAGVSAYGGDFMLEAPKGASGLVDYRGKLVMIYFGFASCPDVCPTSLGVMKSAYNKLSKDEQAKVTGLFISIDPERDTPQIAEDYARYFQENFHGLSGKLEIVTKVAQQYGVLFRKMETPDSAMSYTLDHSSVIYVVDQKGVLREKIQHGITPKELLVKLRQYL